MQGLNIDLLVSDSSDDEQLEATPRLPLASAALHAAAVEKELRPPLAALVSDVGASTASPLVVSPEAQGASVFSSGVAQAPQSSPTPPSNSDWASGCLRISRCATTCLLVQRFCCAQRFQAMSLHILLRYAVS